jgi:hypothetical protein
MFPYLTLMTARVLQDERLREAELHHQAAVERAPHRWRHRIGTGLINAGHALADEPAERPVRARMA